MRGCTTVLIPIESLAAFKADAVVTSVEEAVRRIHRIVAPEEAKAAQQAPVPDNDAERVDALKATGVSGCTRQTSGRRIQHQRCRNHHHR